MNLSPKQQTGALFLFFWLLLFVLYLPASYAGYVSDYTGWLTDLQHSSFWDHINRTHFKVKSLYQFTQLVTWLFFQVFHTNMICWHLLQLTLHAVNITLLYRIFTPVFQKDQVRYGTQIALAGCTLFCIIPSVSEVIVWESAFHYLSGLLLLLSIVRLLQLYIAQPGKGRLLAILVLYLLSTYSIELFYLTPFLCGAMLLFYYRAQPANCRKAAGYVVAPMLVLLLLHFIQVRIAFGHWLPHIKSAVITDANRMQLWAKPLKYLFHLLLLGRFYHQDIRNSVYTFCENPKLIVAFYTLILLLLTVLLIRWKRNGTKAAALLFLYCGLTMALIVPLWFPQLFWVVYDRYSYFFAAFACLLFAFGVYRLTGKYIAPIVLCLFAVINIYATYKANRKWEESARMTDSLMKGLPVNSGKTVLLLNMPYSLNGIYMINGGSAGEAKEMHNALYTPPVTYKLVDVCLNNILSVEDGAHVQVLGDSTVRVTLNQWGTWWWYDDQGAGSYETADYKLNMIDNGHFYELTLKKDPAAYLLLFQVGDQWKQVNMQQKNVEQY